ncbi:MAG TPA: hypothetical protein VLH84_01585 [Patescibacteria group bacterium]|nr:hypothetical protein [Patescibacteria group bacterium]
MTNYKIGEIHNFLTSERVAMHGVAPEVYDQNRQIVGRIAELAQPLGGAALGVQVMGSRAHGCAADTSDLDLGVMRYDSESVIGTFRRGLSDLNLGIELNFAGAVAVHTVGAVVPEQPDAFIGWIERSPYRLGLFDEGVWSAPDLKLTALAALTVISRRQVKVVWGALREMHAEAYLGEQARVSEKLTERLALDPSAGAPVVPDDVWQQRIERFGLPDDIGGYHRSLLTWLEANRRDVRATRGYRLYQDVEKRTRPRRSR